MGRILRIFFPDAFQVDKDWMMGAVWIMVFLLGIYVVSEAFNPKPAYSMSPEMRAFIGCFACYAGLVGFIHKLIANDIL